MSTRLDAFDRRILEIVQDNNLATHREIADSIHLSAPAVARRLQRLRQDGVIWKDISVVRPEHIGKRLIIVVDVAAEDVGSERIAAMKQRFERCPQVQQCYYVTGDVDFVLIMSVKDMEEYVELSRTLFYEGGHVRDIRTSIAMQRVKVSLGIPVGKEDQ
jgi:Lrp/AsnC family transcriptional regulator, leucine-responsive regulatory protein